MRRGAGDDGDQRGDFVGEGPSWRRRVSGNLLCGFGFRGYREREIFRWLYVKVWVREEFGKRSSLRGPGFNKENGLSSF